MSRWPTIATVLALALALGMLSCQEPAASREQAAPPWMAQKKPPQAPLSAEAVEPYRHCQRDTDCVAALNGCCDCANGGVDVAIHRERVEAFRKLFDCRSTHCMNEGAMAPCGSGAVRCTAGLCSYEAPSGASR